MQSYTRKSITPPQPPYLIGSRSKLRSTIATVNQTSLLARYSASYHPRGSLEGSGCPCSDLDPIVSKSIHLRGDPLYPPDLRSLTLYPPPPWINPESLTDTDLWRLGYSTDFMVAEVEAYEGGEYIGGGGTRECQTSFSSPSSKVQDLGLGAVIFFVIGRTGGCRGGRESCLQIWLFQSYVEFLRNFMVATQKQDDPPTIFSYQAGWVLNLVCTRPHRFLILYCPWFGSIGNDQCRNCFWLVLLDYLCYAVIWFS